MLTGSVNPCEIYIAAHFAKAERRLIWLQLHLRLNTTRYDMQRLTTIIASLAEIIVRIRQKINEEQRKRKHFQSP